MRAIVLSVDLLSSVHLSVHRLSIHLPAHLLPAIARRVGRRIAIADGAHSGHRAEGAILLLQQLLLLLLLHQLLLLHLLDLELLLLEHLHLGRGHVAEGILGGHLLGVDLDVRRLELAAVERSHHRRVPAHLLLELLLHVEGAHVALLGLALLPVVGDVDRDVAAGKGVLLGQSGLRMMGMGLGMVVRVRVMAIVLGIAPVHCRRNGDGKPC